ncbi:hypothetical protein GUJ93_ZPchr0002g25798 [Zizania palustris]|uniref:Uncharacterized protein n=1 Tax=Zizania palustris TaxID=103762 RepID=A0A8J5SES2_ZIZPA|nr:hypothetical protein GUJ93_ZPchr0002g25798 [Zizania palustris]
MPLPYTLWPASIRHPTATALHHLHGTMPPPPSIICKVQRRPPHGATPLLPSVWLSVGGLVLRVSTSAFRCRLVNKPKQMDSLDVESMSMSGAHGHSNKIVVDVNRTTKHVGQFTIMIDDVSLLEVEAHGSVNDVLDFLHYCVTLTSDMVGSIKGKGRIHDIS